MFEFRNEKHPFLLVNCPSGKARFVDGEFATADAGLAEELAALDPVHGVQLVAAPEATAPERPAKSGSKADWVAYAVSQGMDAEDAEKHTRDELAARYADDPGGE